MYVMHKDKKKCRRNLIKEKQHKHILDLYGSMDRSQYRVPTLNDYYIK
jgi:hypothetical protein